MIFIFVSSSFAEVNEENYEILNKKIVSLTKQIKGLEKAYPGHDELVTLYENLAEKEALSLDQKTQIENLTKQLEKLETELKAKYEANYEKIIKEQNSTLANYKGENDSLKNELEASWQKYDTLKRQLDVISNQKQMDDLEQDKLQRALEGEIKSLRVQITSIDNANQNISKENATLKLSMQNMAQLEKANKELNDKYNALNAKVIKAQEIADALNKENVEQKNASDVAIAKLEEEVSSLRASLESANSELLKLGQKNQENEKIGIDLEFAQRQSQIAKDELERARLGFEEGRNLLIKQSQEELAAANKINEGLKGSVSSLNAEIVKLKDELSKEHIAKDALKASLDKSKLELKETLDLVEKNKQKAEAEQKEYKERVEAERKEQSLARQKNIEDIKNLNNQLALKEKDFEQSKQQATNGAEKIKQLEVMLEKKSVELKNAAQRQEALSELLSSTTKELNSKIDAYKKEIARLKEEQAISSAALEALSNQKEDLANTLEQTHSKLDAETMKYLENNDLLIKKMSEYEAWVKTDAEKILAYESKQNALEADNKELRETNAALTADIAKIKDELASIQASSSSLLEEKDKLISSKSEEVTQLGDKVKRLEQDLNFINVGLKNLALKETLSCDELGVGKDKLDGLCQAKIIQLINTYKDGAIYELEGFVDDTGFAGINSSKLADKEKQRLTRLANFGLAKDRVQNAIKLIKEQEPAAKVFLSDKITIKKDARGFLIRVYR